jgi:hypothetical protein
MIYQINPVKTKTETLPTINKSLLQARHIQAHVKEQTHTQSLPNFGYLFSPDTAGPVLVPVTRWIE